MLLAILLVCCVLIQTLARPVVHAGYRLSTGPVGFTLGQYDHSRALTIDPVLGYAGYLGGPASEWGTAIAVDSSGDAYVAGYSNGRNYPTLNPIQNTIEAGTDLVLSELNPSGSSLLYSTYLGGNGADVAAGLALDGASTIYLTGYTSSSDFPGDQVCRCINNRDGDRLTNLDSAGGASLTYDYKQADRLASYTSGGHTTYRLAAGDIRHGTKAAAALAALLPLHTLLVASASYPVPSSLRTSHAAIGISLDHAHCRYTRRPAHRALLRVARRLSSAARLGCPRRL